MLLIDPRKICMFYIKPLLFVSQKFIKNNEFLEEIIYYETLFKIYWRYLKNCLQPNICIDTKDFNMKKC